MATFTKYFTDQMCAEAVRDGHDGKPVDAVGHRGRLKPRKGDVVVLITSRRRTLYVLGALEVDRIEEEVERLADFCEDYGDAVVISTVVHGKSLAPFRFDRALTDVQMKQWVFESSSGPRPLGDHFERSASVRNFAKVSAETAAMLDRVIGRAPPLSELPGAQAVEEKLREAPRDVHLAQVLSDAWQAAGDPRGELLSLELALRTELEPARIEAIDARLSELARKTRTARTRPGGFPFRSVWGTRDVFELDTRFPLETSSVETALQRVGAWLDVEGVSKLVFRMNRVPRPLEERLEDLGASQSWTDRPQSHAWEWRRRTVMPVAELRPWLLEYPIDVTFTGRPRMPGTTCAAPLLTQQVWRGTRPMSLATVQFHHRASRVIHLVLRLPEDTAFGSALEARVTEHAHLHGSPVRRRSIIWGPEGARAVPPLDPVPRYSDPLQKRLVDPGYSPRERDGPVYVDPRRLITDPIWRR